MKYLHLIRYKNILFIILLMCLMRYCIIIPWVTVFGGEIQMSTMIFVLLVLATSLIAAGGYAINDYFDVKIDMLNRPDKVIVGQSITRETASRVHLICSGVGILSGMLVSFLARNTTLGFIFILVPGLLWFYSASYKRQFLIGNIIISICSGLVPVIEVIAESSFLINHYTKEALSQTLLIPTLYKWVCGFALFAFLITMIREIIKDMQDEYGDRETECRTMPVVLGLKKTKIILIGFILLTMTILTIFVLKYIHFPTDNISIKYLIIGSLLPFLYLIYLIWKARVSVDYKQASGFVKFIMLIGSLYSVIVYILLSINYDITLFGLFKST